MATNLLDALKHHLQTGEVPESIRETLGGPAVLVPIEGQPEQPAQFGQPARRHVPGIDAEFARLSGPVRRDRVRPGARVSLEELEAQDGETTRSGVPGAVAPQPGVVGVGVAGRAGAAVGGRADRQVAGGPAGRGDAGDGGAGGAAPAAEGKGAAGGAVSYAGVPARVTPTGEVEPPLPFGQGDVQTQRRLQQRYNREDEVERLRHEHRMLGARIAAVNVGGLPPPTRATLGMPLVTTDDTLEADLQASLEATAPAAEPLDYEHPVALDQLPPFAYVSGPAGVGKTFWAKADRKSVV